MSDEMDRAAQIDADIKKADAKRRADAAEVAMTDDKLEKILTHLDSLGKRMDAYDARRKDEEGESEDEIEKNKPRELAADIRKDSAADAEEIEAYKALHGAARKVAADSVIMPRFSDSISTAG